MVAIIISLTVILFQAWWRGVMVRRCLGVYKKRKDIKAKLMKIQKGK